MILQRKVIEHLSQKLMLPFEGIEQDWDLEMADSKRLKDFISFYKENELTTEEKQAMMALVLASYDDFLNEQQLKIDDTWGEIKEILESDERSFKDLINKWALINEENEDDLFLITPLVRIVKVK